MIVTLGLIALSAVVGMIVGAIVIGVFLAWVISWLFNHAADQL